MKITTDLVMSWGPCDAYPRERVQELLREGKTPLEICDMDIPEQDRVWTLLHEEVIPAALLHELACVFAEHTLENERTRGREPDPRSWAAIDAKRKWLKGEIATEELAAARDTAWAAAWDTAWAAAWAAAWDAESRWQLDQIRKILMAIAGTRAAVR